MATKPNNLIKKLQRFNLSLKKNQKQQQKALEEISKLADELEITSIKKKLNKKTN